MLMQYYIFKHFSTFLANFLDDDDEEKTSIYGANEAVELEEAANQDRLLPSNGRPPKPAQTQSNSITEISLSPLHVPSALHDDSPAVVAIDTLDADDDNVITKDFGKKDKLIITECSSSVYSMEGDAMENSAVCGRNGWCVLS